MSDVHRLKVLRSALFFCWKWKSIRWDLRERFPAGLGHLEWRFGVGSCLVAEGGLGYFEKICDCNQPAGNFSRKSFLLGKVFFLVGIVSFLFGLNFCFGFDFGNRFKLVFFCLIYIAP